MRSLIFPVLILVGAIAIGGYLIYGTPRLSEESVTTTPQAQMETNATNLSTAEVLATNAYTCAEGKTLEADYSQTQATVRLSDGRSYTLPQTTVSSGVRYANIDGSQVFWSKGDSAFFEEQGQTTYGDCVQTSSTLDMDIEAEAETSVDSGDLFLQ